MAHILYLDGLGRTTPYTSTSEDRESAQFFAGHDGRIWTTDHLSAAANGAGVISHKDLLHLLKGRGKGKARWRSAIEVAQARAFVLRWKEHLLDWRKHTAIAAAIQATFR